MPLLFIPELTYYLSTVMTNWLILFREIIAICSENHTKHINTLSCSRFRDWLEETTKREPSAWGYNWATLFLEDINMGFWPSRLGSLGSARLKYGLESRGTRRENDCAGEDQQQL
jgi:hypothetical protein